MYQEGYLPGRYNSGIYTQGGYNSGIYTQGGIYRRFDTGRNIQGGLPHREVYTRKCTQGCIYQEVYPGRYTLGLFPSAQRAPFFRVLFPSAQRPLPPPMWYSRLRRVPASLPVPFHCWAEFLPPSVIPVSLLVEKGGRLVRDYSL